MLVGNKVDLVQGQDSSKLREVSAEEAQMLAQGYSNMVAVETSANTSVNVTKTFS